MTEPRVRIICLGLTDAGHGIYARLILQGLRNVLPDLVSNPERKLVQHV